MGAPVAGAVALVESTASTETHRTMCIMREMAGSVRVARPCGGAKPSGRGRGTGGTAFDPQRENRFGVVDDTCNPLVSRRHHDLFVSTQKMKNAISRNTLRFTAWSAIGGGLLAYVTLGLLWIVTGWDTGMVFRGGAMLALSNETRSVFRMGHAHGCVRVLSAVPCDWRLSLARLPGRGRGFGQYGGNGRGAFRDRRNVRRGDPARRYSTSLAGVHTGRRGGKSRRRHSVGKPLRTRRNENCGGRFSFFGP